MPMLFNSTPQVIRAGGPPNIRGGFSSNYAGYRASSFPPATAYPGMGSNYAGYRAPSFPPATPCPGGRMVPLPAMSGGFTRFAYNQPPYFSGLGDTTPPAPASTDILSGTMDWITANPLLAGGLAIGAVVLLGSKAKRRRK